MTCSVHETSRIVNPTSALTRGRVSTEGERLGVNAFWREKDVSKVVSVGDMRELARRQLPKMIYDFVDGGTEDEVTLRANVAAFDRLQFQPSALVDVSGRTMETEIAGMPVKAPIVMAPAGLTRVVHPEAERAVAKAAGARGIPYAVTPWSTFTIEELAAAATGPLWFEVNPMPDFALVESLVKRAHAADFAALLYMVDCPIGGRHERELRRQIIPPRYTPRNVIDGALHPRWAINFLKTAHLISPRNLDGAEFPRHLFPRPGPFPAFGAQLGSPAGTWDDLRRVRDLWDRPLGVKGVMSPADAVRSVEAGADFVIVSNHGGRQLDSLPATIEILPEIVAAVDGRASVLLDGGVRRGTHIAKALALGASACLVGRPYHYGLAVAGQAGVERVIDMLSDEFSRTMAQLGCPRVSDISTANLRPAR
jgi:isopentenyl diphosphate isomerase/L-lactate dehydrogenase-like FMN-dependent dehydrogenase